MNTRGIVQLVVLNIGVELGVISPMIFAIFVLMATILTFLTSPILYLLYRHKIDTQKLSVPNIAADLRDAREGDMNMSEQNDNNGNIPTISNGDINSKELRRNSTKGSLSSMPTHDTFVTFDDRVNYSEIYLNEQEMEDNAEPGSLPYRCIKMTRF
jgi:hypothetical protein